MSSKNFKNQKVSSARVSVPDALGRGRVIQTFTSSGSWTPPQGVTVFEYLVVAGGGGGGCRTGTGGGGGGGGGVRAGNAYIAPGQTFAVTVGAGGTGKTPGPGLNLAGGKGSDSSLISAGTHGTVIKATGGGGGGAMPGPGTATGGGGGPGGSGGGSVSSLDPVGGTYVVQKTSGNEGVFFPIEGYSGGTANSLSPAYRMQSGGGGAGGPGEDSVYPQYWPPTNPQYVPDGFVTLRGNGGAAYFSSISGPEVGYGGGGGSSNNGIGGTNAGSGGTDGGSGTTNRGGGGGGGTTSSGSGGSGVIIVRYG